MRAACYRRLAFDPERQNGASANVDAKEGDTDEDDDMPAIATANGVYAHNCDWNDIEKSERPTRAESMLLHQALILHIPKQFIGNAHVNGHRERG